MTNKYADGAGALFTNAGKVGKEPDLTGHVRVGGVLHRLAAWKRTAANGREWLSLKVEPTVERRPQSEESDPSVTTPALDDQVPS